jgi:hypothetical protein
MSFSLFGGDGSPNGPRAKSGDCHTDAVRA